MSRNNLIINLPSYQNSLIRTFWFVISVFMWCLWLFLWAPLVSALHIHYKAGRIPEIFWEPEKMEFLYGLFTFVFLFGVGYVFWVSYNFLRFKKCSRRKTIKYLSNQQLSDFFQIKEFQVSELHKKKAIAISYDNSGLITNLSNILVNENSTDLAIVGDEAPQQYQFKGIKKLQVPSHLNVNSEDTVQTNKKKKLIITSNSVPIKALIITFLIFCTLFIMGILLVMKQGEQDNQFNIPSKTASISNPFNIHLAEIHSAFPILLYEELNNIDKLQNSSADILISLISQPKRVETPISTFMNTPVLQSIDGQVKADPIKKNNINERIDNLLKQANRQLTKKQLTTPDDDSAWLTFQKILALEPGNKLALTGLEKISNYYILWAREQIKKDKFILAKYYFNKALEASPGNKEALSGLIELRKYQSKPPQQ